MAISLERIRADIQAIARCTATPGAGATRPTFSAAWAVARDYVSHELERINCSTRVDGAGNLHARPKDLAWTEPAWLCGSHLDTVPHGGDYDGVTGVVVALELLRSAADDGINAFPLELIEFAEEEGTTFGLGMIGSRALTGELSNDQLSHLRNAAGENYLDAGKPFGVDPARLQEDLSHLLGMIEVHIEQGPGMWRRDQRLAVVGAIAGRRQYRLTITGQANHAGATAMSDRRDAIAGAAEIIVALEQMAKGFPAAVVTVGRMAVHPNAINVIPDRVEFSVDWRAPSDVTLELGDLHIRKIVAEICFRRELGSEIQQNESIAACPMNERLCNRFGDLPRVNSGALHDSAVIARYMPTAMLFVPSRDGISHNSHEFSRFEDIAAAAKAVEQVVRRPALAQLNRLDEEEFVLVCGRFYENSPWIARRAWAKRPFASIADLHEKLRGVVAGASDSEQLALIGAHPDLVSRMTLTAESAGEQAAAGLDRLTPQEIAAFGRFNAVYREKFGFPFVICARQNRKDAILAAFPARLANDRLREVKTALEEIHKIAWLRLNDAIWEAQPC
jgi:allantoate deiminase